MEFANEKATLHDKGSYSSKVKHYAALREVLLVEDLKNVLPDKIGVYLNREKVTTLGWKSHASIQEAKYTSLIRKIATFIENII